MVYALFLYNASMQSEVTAGAGAYDTPEYTEGNAYDEAGTVVMLYYNNCMWSVLIDLLQNEIYSSTRQYEEPANAERDIYAQLQSWGVDRINHNDITM